MKSLLACALFAFEMCGCKHVPFTGNREAPTRPTLLVKHNSVPVIHVVVALCDNKYQGIVPVPARIGNGDDLVDNLYWGADYGVKSYFRRAAGWKVLATVKNPSPKILERVIFQQAKSKAILVADAYRGREIRKATEDFIAFASGAEASPIQIKNQVVSVGGGADMVVYVGHNGLMDFQVSLNSIHRGTQPHKTAILCCKSKRYFEAAMRAAGADPLLWTKDLMAPEAYVLESAVQSFLKHETNAQASTRASIAYAKYQHCSVRGAQTIFTSGF